MRPNRLRELWNDERAAVNGWLVIPNASSAEVMADLGHSAPVCARESMASHEVATT